ncbi:MAG: addiction module protein [Chloroflexi bacterium]|nr:addiction module protein [Chloroflexota bacterium]
MATVESVLREALSLAPGDRELVAQRLIQSIDAAVPEEPPPGYDAAWDEELRSRLERIDSGDAVLHDLRDVRRDIFGRTD